MPDQPVLDPAALENLRALSPDDGGAFMREVIEIFLQETPARLEQLDQAYAVGDADGITAIAHSIKGSCGNFGATRLASITLAVEQCGKRGDVTTARTLGPEVVAAFAATRTALEKLVTELK